MWGKLKLLPGFVRALVGVRANLLVAWPPSYFEKTMIVIPFLHRKMFIVNDPEGVQQVMVTNARKYEKSGVNRAALQPLLGDGVFVSSGDLWARQRKIMQPAFHQRRIRSYAAVMVETGLEWVDRWRKLGDGAEIEITEEMTNLTAEVITRTMFGDRLGERTKSVFDAFKKYQETLGRVHVSDLFGLPHWIPRGGLSAGRKAVRELDSVFNDLIEKHRDDDNGKEDLLSLLLTATIEPNDEPIPPKLIRDEVASIFLAGHETTAITLSWAFYLLERHPDKAELLSAELEEVLSSGKPTYEDYPRLRYTRAVIEETLRLYPPVHAFSRIALEDDEICGENIPRNSLITIAAWLLHRHRKYWQEPDSFIPERFLPENSHKIEKFSYIPFGAGPRTCPGMHFGLMESVLMLALLSRHFRLQLRTGHPVTPIGRLTLRPSNGLPMTIELR